MRIALYSHWFPPHIGGSGVHAKLLAEGLAGLGHSVTVITHTSSPIAEEATGPFQLVRQPTLRQLCARLAESDLVLEIGPCITAGFLARAMRKPLVIAHQMFPARGMRGLAQRVVCAGVPNVACSTAVARALPTWAAVIPNAYDDGMFQNRLAPSDRRHDVVFVGRLIAEKGLQNVFLALDLLRQRDRALDLTVVGAGPQEESCREMSRKFGLDHQVRFVGAASPVQLADIYNAHRIAVVPSVWEEPFGIVALEAIACGCAVVGSISGGLPEAIGPCGMTYPKASIRDLACRLEQLMMEPRLVDAMQSYAKNHLARHTRRAVASGYLTFINGCFPHLAFPERRSAHRGAARIGLVRRANG
jgi:glycosyltransferase involved in cell wall biosynthesis